MKDRRDIIVRPVVSEKSYGQHDESKYTFEVAGTANKIEIGRAVSEQFAVTVVKVNTMWVRGRKRRMGRMPAGYTAKWKKAIVTLSPGQRIPVFEVG